MNILRPLARSLRCSSIALTSAKAQVAPTLRQLHVTAASRAGMGEPLPVSKPIDYELVEEDELLWDDGSGFYNEECLDKWSTLIDKYTALMMLTGALSGFGALAYAAKLNDKKSQLPFVPKQFPFDNLKEELGGFSIPSKYA
eukprot:CAMPEP_0196581340 /NCGR_PEP_ID=MMETSP1081-20130531/33705_1 /TAXON_ID=36882 /ORGANISM="Pyramimonas amylifera, Strain CCMP720" /LENGTH=141 /DNA_ID=CAMNT_0041901541 /DNA_START=68 /DNA_END=493 /DNA_ORIENTATION=-